MAATRRKASVAGDVAAPPPDQAGIVRHEPLLTLETQRACAEWDVDAATRWRFVPLRVTAHLASAVVYARIEELALDGLLASAALLHVLRGGYYDLLAPDTGDEFVHLRLPLALQGPAARAAEALPSGTVIPVPHLDARHGESLGWWWWTVASPQPVGPVAYDVQHFHKRFDTRADLSDHLAFATDDPTKQRIQINGGRYKSWRRPVQSNSLIALTWRCVGDAATVRMLLDEEITSLGKHRAQGFGAIREWRVEADPDGDGSLWLPSSAGGGFARPVPVAALGAFGLTSETLRTQWPEPPREEYVGYRTPRWMPEHQTVCVVGGTRR